MSGRIFDVDVFGRISTSTFLIVFPMSTCLVVFSVSASMFRRIVGVPRNSYRFTDLLVGVSVLLIDVIFYQERMKDAVRDWASRNQVSIQTLLDGGKATFLREIGYE